MCEGRLPSCRLPVPSVPARRVIGALAVPPLMRTESLMVMSESEDALAETVVVLPEPLMVSEASCVSTSSWLM